MKLMKLLGTQNDSAARLTMQAGLRIGSNAIVKLLIGATPDVTRVCGGVNLFHEEGVMLHFCSAQLQVRHELARGCDRLATEWPELRFEFDLPHISHPSFVDCFAQIEVREQELVFRKPGLMRAVTISEDAVTRTPWAFPGGGLFSAGARGFLDVHQWLESEGVLIKN